MEKDELAVPPENTVIRPVMELNSFFSYTIYRTARVLSDLSYFLQDSGQNKIETLTIFSPSLARLKIF